MTALSIRFNVSAMLEPIQKKNETIKSKVRDLKSKGFTLADIGESLGIGKGLAHYYGKASPRENLCPRCARPFKKK